MAREKLAAFVDYENLRQAFRDYVEPVTVEDVVHAFEALGEELGELRSMQFYGDWTRRPQDAHAIEERGWRTVNVLSTRYGKDRSDIPIAFDMYDTAREKKDVTAVILGSGDSGFKEAILRAKECGKRVYVLCFGASVSREFFTLTQGVFPLEVRLNLTEKVLVQAPMPGIKQDEVDVTLAELIRRLDSLEKSLPYVVRNYFRDRILLPNQQFGETAADVDALLDRAREAKVLDECEVPNPQLSGRTVKAVKLNRDNSTVQDTLKTEREKAG